MGQGGQTFTICGDLGLILGVYVVPDTRLSWTRNAMSEIVERHKSAKVPVPKLFTLTDHAATGNWVFLKHSPT